MSSGARNLTKAKVLKAIKNSGGIVSTVARRLDCDWNTAKKYINKWEASKQAMKNEEETILDAAEGVLFDSILEEKDVQSAKWILSVKGKARGYNDKLDVNLSGAVEHKKVTLEDIESQIKNRTPREDD